MIVDYIELKIAMKNNKTVIGIAIILLISVVTFTLIVIHSHSLRTSRAVTAHIQEIRESYHREIEFCQQIIAESSLPRVSKNPLNQPFRLPILFILDKRENRAITKISHHYDFRYELAQLHGPVNVYKRQLVLGEQLFKGDSMPKWWWGQLKNPNKDSWYLILQSELYSDMRIASAYSDVNDSKWHHNDLGVTWDTMPSRAQSIVLFTREYRKVGFYSPGGDAYEVKLTGSFYSLPDWKLLVISPTFSGYPPARSDGYPAEKKAWDAFSQWFITQSDQ